MSDYGKPYQNEDEDYQYGGKVISHEVGWDGQYASVLLSDLLETAGREFPGVPLSELGITIRQESFILLLRVGNGCPRQ